MDAGRVVVAGAGLAGLVAADRLVRDSWTLAVLEARGSRRRTDWSHRLSNGAIAEAGRGHSGLELGFPRPLPS